MEVPFYSQYAPDVPEEWRDKACGVVALKMAMDGFGAKTPSITELIQEAKTIGAFKDGYWVHQRLTWLAHNYGVPAYSEEFRSDAVHVGTGGHVPSVHAEAMRACGIQKVQKVLASGGLALASVSKHFQPDGHHHLILLTGVSEEGFTYHDPAYVTAKEGARRVVSFDAFREHWRAFAIFLESGAL